jgi:TPP-dependent pyruvate/acetoin dehydrogenase alpha subunit
MSTGAGTTSLQRERALGWLHGMLRIRRFEEKCSELYSATKIRGFLHLYIGEEAVAVGTMQALGPDDAVFATYREHGHALARGVAMGEVMAEMFGKVEGCSRGRGGSMHLFDRRRKFFGGNAIVGGALPMAVGMALAQKMESRSEVTACFFGEGAVAGGAQAGARARRRLAGTPGQRAGRRDHGRGRRTSDAGSTSGRAPRDASGDRRRDEPIQA